MILTASSLKRLSKYEMEFDKNLSDVKTTGTYTMKTDDLKEALQNMLEDPDFERILNGWYTPVSYFMDSGAILTEEGFPKGRFAGLKEILEGKNASALEGMLGRLENGDEEPEVIEEATAEEIIEEPVTEEAAAPEEPEAVEEPVVEEPAAKEEPAAEEPASEEAPAEEIIEEPVVEEAASPEEPEAAEEQVAEEPAAEEPAAEEPASEEAPAEEIIEEPVVEESAAPEEPEASEEAPVAEEPAAEEVIEEAAEETPICEKAAPIFSEKEKWNKIVLCASNPNDYSEEDICLARSFLEEFAGEGDIVALRYKAFSCLQGGGLYAQDLSLAKECFASLFEKTQKPQYAGILGSLYKNDAEAPDYKKAFYYYLQGAAGGDDDACAALGDMFVEGQFAEKNPSIAERIYTQLYNTTSAGLEEGKTSMTFVQTAMKIGGLKLLAKEPALALPYYEKAREAYLVLTDNGTCPVDPVFIQKLDQFIDVARRLAEESTQ